MELSEINRVWQCGDKSLPLHSRTLIMGILNVTPDSFSDGGRFMHIEQAVAHAVQMERDGADIIDIGGESTRPGSLPVAEEEEIKRVVPVIEELAGRVNIPLSVDTYKASVAQAALDAGAEIVNDISGLRFDRNMASVVARAGAGLVLMHIKGTPRNMQKNPFYRDLLGEIKSYLNESKEMALRAGVAKNRIVIDPGIGFGKRLEDNFEIIRSLAYFRDMGLPILVGPSRKSFIGLTLDVPAEERLEGTAAAVTACILNGADIVRVHDVKEMKRVAIITDILAGKSEVNAV